MKKLTFLNGNILEFAESSNTYVSLNKILNIEHMYTYAIYKL